MNALQLIQQASKEMGLPVPNGAAGATDKRTVQLFALMNALGDELVRLHEWQRLITEYTFVTDGTDDYALPSAFDRPINRTHWDRTNKWSMRGPVLPAGWQWLQSSSVALASPFVRWRLQGNRFNVFPTPASGNTYAFEYVSKNWGIDGDDSSTKAQLTKDTDTVVYPDRLMIVGIKLKFHEAHGLDSSVFARDFGYVLEQVKGQEAGAPALSLSRPAHGGLRLLDEWNLPDTGYGS